MSIRDGRHPKLEQTLPLADRLANLRNGNVMVHESSDGIIFLHKIAPGSADKSYGIHVAARAGIPAVVLQRAHAVLAELEAHHLQAPARTVDHISRPKLEQASLFAGTDDPVMQELRAFEVEGAAPEGVVEQVQRWQRELRGE